MSIRDYFTTAALNIGLFPENMQRSDVNDSARQMQADLRGFADELPLYEFTDTITYVSATSFSATGDFTALLPVNTRVQAVGAGTGTINGTVDGVSESGGVTTVSVVWDSGSLSNESLRVWKSTIEFATQAEAEAGTNTLNSMNSLRSRQGLVAAMTASQDLSVDGYQAFPGGLILQWGRETALSDNTTVTFPLAFPTACFVAIPVSSITGDTGGVDTSVAISTDPTTTTVEFSSKTSLEEFFWIAVGH